MKVAIACDHGGFARKNLIANYLKEAGYEVVDFGTDGEASCDYPDYALAAAEAVASGQCERGIAVCTTGIGMSIAANKVPGVRCALCTDEHAAQMTRLHNDANMLALGAASVDEARSLAIVKVFLETPFSGEERHSRRIGKIAAIERKYLK